MGFSGRVAGERRRRGCTGPADGYSGDVRSADVRRANLPPLPDGLAGFTVVSLDENRVAALVRESLTFLVSFSGNPNTPAPHELSAALRRRWESRCTTISSPTSDRDSPSITSRPGSTLRRTSSKCGSGSFGSQDGGRRGSQESRRSGEVAQTTGRSCQPDFASDARAAEPDQTGRDRATQER